MEIPPCKADDCAAPGEWQVLRVREHQPPHGFIHSGKLFAPYRINHVRQAEYCLGHARLMAIAKNREAKKS